MISGARWLWRRQRYVVTRHPPPLDPTQHNTRPNATPQRSVSRTSALDGSPASHPSFHPPLYDPSRRRAACVSGSSTRGWNAVVFLTHARAAGVRSSRPSRAAVGPLVPIQMRPALSVDGFRRSAQARAGPTDVRRRRAVPGDGGRWWAVGEEERGQSGPSSCRPPVAANQHILRIPQADGRSNGARPLGSARLGGSGEQGPAQDGRGSRIPRPAGQPAAGRSAA